MRSQMAKLESADPPSSAGGQADSDYISKYREFKYFETLFELFSKQYEIARVDESREGAVIQVVDVAVAPELKTKPKKAIIAVLAALAAGFALLVFVFVRHSLRNAAQDADVARKLSALQVAFGRALGSR